MLTVLHSLVPRNLIGRNQKLDTCECKAIISFSCRVSCTLSSTLLWLLEFQAVVHFCKHHFPEASFSVTSCASGATSSIQCAPQVARNRLFPKIAATFGDETFVWSHLQECPAGSSIQIPSFVDIIFAERKAKHCDKLASNPDTVTTASFRLKWFVSWLSVQNLHTIG